MSEHSGNHADYSNFKKALKDETLQNVVDNYSALASDTTNWVANLANASSLLWHAYILLGIPVNWAGFYVLDPENSTRLILGPFQGKVACQTINLGHGVCGIAASTMTTQVVGDVEKFPGHIACDGETKSELVVPIIKDGSVLGVIDIDCLAVNGFDESDKLYVEKLAACLAVSNKWT